MSSINRNLHTKKIIVEWYSIDLLESFVFSFVYRQYEVIFRAPLCELIRSFTISDLYTLSLNKNSFAEKANYVH